MISVHAALAVALGGSRPVTSGSGWLAEMTTTSDSPEAVAVRPLSRCRSLVCDGGAIWRPSFDGDAQTIVARPLRELGIASHSSGRRGGRTLR